MSILMKLVNNEPIEESDIVIELQEKCEKSVPDSCDNNCPVFKANGGEVPYVGRGNNRRCSCRMDGRKILEFLRKKRKEWI
jgi:hypothetical protein